MCGVPGGPAPSTQQTEAHFAAVIQVGVEPDAATPCGHEVYLRGRVRVVGWQEYVEEEAAIGIWCACWTNDHCPVNKHAVMTYSTLQLGVCAAVTYAT